jgi:hypothetical protein
MRPRILAFKNHSRSCRPSRLWQAPLARRSAKDARDVLAHKSFRAWNAAKRRASFSSVAFLGMAGPMPYFGPEPMVTFTNDSGGRVVVCFQRSHHIQKLVAKPAARGFDTACGARGFARFALRANGEVRGLPGPPRPAAFLCGFCCMVRGKISSP